MVYLGLSVLQFQDETDLESFNSELPTSAGKE